LMTRFSLLPVCAGLVLVAGCWGNPAQRDEKRFQGTWDVAAMEIAGVPEPADKIHGLKYVFGPNKTFQIEEGEQVEREGTFALNAEAQPPTVVLVSDGARRLTHGIYQFEGDTLKLCFPHRSGAVAGYRPAEFVSQGEPHPTDLVTLRHE
jgi:uncharacterized protein (TIGR03067 family)